MEDRKQKLRETIQRRTPQPQNQEQEDTDGLYIDEETGIYYRYDEEAGEYYEVEPPKRNMLMENKWNFGKTLRSNRKFLGMTPKVGIGIMIGAFIGFVIIRYLIIPTLG